MYLLRPNMITCYKMLDNLPKVPQQYVDYALGIISGVTDPYATHTNPNPEKQGRLLSKGGKLYKSRGNPRYSLEDQMSEWVTKNISPEWLTISVGNNSPSPGTNPEESTIHGPHTDQSRAYALIYLLEKGNEDQYTKFYQEPGQGVHRKRNVTIYDMDSLIELDSVCAPLHTWLYLNASILHSVENVLGNRISIVVGFECDPLGVFVK